MTQTATADIMTPAFVTALLRDEAAVRILDVRTPGEFDSAHIRGAYNVPLDTLPEHARAMGMMLARLPYNRAASCDPAAVVRALTGNGEAGGPRNRPAAAPATTCCTG